MLYLICNLNLFLKDIFVFVDYTTEECWTTKDQVSSPFLCNVHSTNKISSERSAGSEYAKNY